MLIIYLGILVNYAISENLSHIGIYIKERLNLVYSIYS